MVAVMNVETLEITCQVIGCTRIEVPVLFVGGCRCRVAGALLLLIIAPAAITRVMPPYVADLTLGAPPATSSSVAAVVAAIAVIATTVLATSTMTARPLSVASLDRAVLSLRATTRGTTAARAR
jgi:hypothetical protein